MRINGNSDGVVMIAGNTAQAAESCGIKVTSKVFTVLTAGLYPNKPKAIIREICSNAYDAHVEAGRGDLPFVVTLPSAADPVLKVRDFGLGMNHEFMMKHFRILFDSSKTERDDLVGAMGLGSKSPLSYVSQFTVIVYQQLKMRVYSIFLAEDGFPSVVMLSETDTDQDDGTEVMISVKSSDIAAFNTNASQVLQWFPVPPTILGGTGTTITKPKYEAIHHVAIGESQYRIGLRSRDVGYMFATERTTKKTGSSGLNIVMGTVAYPFDVESMSMLGESVPLLTGLSDEEHTRRLHAYFDRLVSRAVVETIAEMNIDLYVAIGDCDILPSREGLSYDQRTQENLVRIIRAVVDDSIVDCMRQMREFSDLYSASEFRRTLITTPPLAAYITYSLSYALRRMTSNTDVTNRSQFMDYLEDVSASPLISRIFDVSGKTQAIAWRGVPAKGIPLDVKTIEANETFGGIVKVKQAFAIDARRYDNEESDVKRWSAIRISTDIDNLRSGNEYHPERFSYGGVAFDNPVFVSAYPESRIIINTRGTAGLAYIRAYATSKRIETFIVKRHSHHRNYHKDSKSHRETILVVDITKSIPDEMVELVKKAINPVGLIPDWMIVTDRELDVADAELDMSEQRRQQQIEQRAARAALRAEQRQQRSALRDRQKALSTLDYFVLHEATNKYTNASNALTPVVDIDQINKYTQPTEGAVKPFIFVQLKRWSAIAIGGVSIAQIGMEHSKLDDPYTIHKWLSLLLEDAGVNASIVFYRARAKAPHPDSLTLGVIHERRSAKLYCRKNSDHVIATKIAEHHDQFALVRHAKVSPTARMTLSPDQWQLSGGAIRSADNGVFTRGRSNFILNQFTSADGLCVVGMVCDLLQVIADHAKSDRTKEAIGVVVGAYRDLTNSAAKTRRAHANLPERVTMQHEGILPHVVEALAVIESESEHIKMAKSYRDDQNAYITRRIDAYKNFHMGKQRIIETFYGEFAMVYPMLNAIVKMLSEINDLPRKLSIRDLLMHTPVFCYTDGSQDPIHETKTETLHTKVAHIRDLVVVTAECIDSAATAQRMKRISRTIAKSGGIAVTDMRHTW